MEREKQRKALVCQLQDFINLKSKMELKRGTKVFLEDFAIFLILISAVYKDNIYSFFYIILVAVFAIKRNGSAFLSIFAAMCLLVSI